MMLFRLPKRKPCSIILPFFTAHQSTHHRFCSASSTKNPDLKLPNFKFDEYLINYWGFSPDKAGRYSKYLDHLKSPKQPDSVICFLKRQGFSEADIKIIIKRNPNLLACSPEKTLDPNLCALRRIGLSDPALTKILLSYPATLQRPFAVPRIKFWWDFFGGDETDLVKALNRNKGLIDLDVGRNIEPKISLLHSHGLSTKDIVRIVLKVSRFITYSLCLMENMLKRTQELGFQTYSGMFVLGLHAVSRNNCLLAKKKMDLLKSFGWSENELLSALQKCPSILSLSEENLRTKMDFLVREVRCEPSYIACHSVLLPFSLEKRLRPRHHVMQLLKSKGLYGKKHSFYTIVVTLSDKSFVERYILPHKEDNPDLHETYLAACAIGSRSPFGKSK